MEIGKLYKCSEYYLVIYPSEEASVSGMATRASTAVATRSGAGWVELWSEVLSCTVRYSEPGEVFMCLEVKSNIAHVLFGEKQGWIINRNWLGLRRVK